MFKVWGGPFEEMLGKDRSMVASSDLGLRLSRAVRYCATPIDPHV